jgi:hypothetical protein
MRPIDAFLYATNMNKILDFLKHIDSWRKVLGVAATCAILLTSFYVYKEIERADKFKSMNPWDYFQEQKVSDPDGLYAVIDDARKNVSADVVAVYMYQPQGLHFYRRLETLSPKGQHTDYCASELRTPLYNMSRTLNELQDAGLSVVTITSNHYDVKLLLTLSLNVAYVVPIDVNGVDIGHIIFAFNEKPDDIPLNEMRATVEKAKLKIF